LESISKAQQIRKESQFASMQSQMQTYRRVLNLTL
jgi:hypothetical protein